MMVKNESLAGAVTECDANPNGVADTTSQRCANYYFMQFNSWEYMYYQNRDGSLRNSFGSRRLFQEACANQATLRAVLERNETAFDQLFRTYAHESFDDDQHAQTASADSARASSRNVIA